MQRFLLTILTCVALVACTERGRVVVYPDATASGKSEDVYFSTTRRYAPGSPTIFSRERTYNPSYGMIQVSIPPDREPGEVRWPRSGRAPDPRTEFLASRVEIHRNRAEFATKLNAAVARQPKGEKDIVLFVHGFNNNFAESVYRIAQLGHDLSARAVLTHYSWPSQGQALGYAYDRDSAAFARDGLARMIEDLSRSPADGIILVAHSMGSYLTMEALRQLSLSGRDDVLRRIRGVVLMSPDIDIEVFRTEVYAIKRLPKPFYIFTSRKDGALDLSARLSGEPARLGNISDATQLADLEVTILDTTAFSTGLGHFDAGSSPALINLLTKMGTVYDAFEGDISGRTGILPGAVISLQRATQIVAAPVNAVSGD